MALYYDIIEWHEHNQVTIRFETKSGTHEKRIQLDGTNIYNNKTYTKFQHDNTKFQHDKDDKDEKGYRSIMTLWCIWKYRKDSIIARLPKDVLKLLVYKYIFNVKNPHEDYNWMAFSEKAGQKLLKSVLGWLFKVIFLVVIPIFLVVYTK